MAESKKPVEQSDPARVPEPGPAPASPPAGQQDAGYTWNEEKQVWVFHNPTGSMGYNYLYRDYETDGTD